MFAVGEFRALWLAQLASVAGDQLARVALTVLVYDRSRSPLLAAITYAASIVPGFLGGVMLSGLADRLPRHVLNQGRVRRVPAYRRAFNAAAVGLSYGTASVALHAILPGAAWRAPGLGPHAPVWAAVVLACGAIQWAVNTTLVVTAVRGAEPAGSVRQMTFNTEALFNDLAEFCTALVFALIAASNALLVVVTLPFVILLQRSGRRAELTHASRIDAKTGPLNTVTWQREAAVQVTRAVRTRTPARGCHAGHPLQAGQ